MSTTSDRLRELGLELPVPPDARRAFVPVQRAGNLLYVSGQTPMRAGELTVRGLVGAEVDEKTAREAARLSVLNALARLDREDGGLDAVTQVVRLTVYVASAPDFVRQPAVADAASELLVDVFGEAGAHARSAIGAAVLPGNAPVEVEMIVRAEERA